MSMTALSEERTDELPIPYVDLPVGTLTYDGHTIDIWSLATTADGGVIFLNGSAADAALSATLKRLLRKGSGSATFQPAPGMSWSGPTEIRRLPDHYDTVTAALTYKGLRLKNQCLIPDCLNIAAGLARPLETVSGDGTDTETFDTEMAEMRSDASPFRYVLGDATNERPPTGALFAHLKSLVVVCHPEWEEPLWEQGMKRALLLPQPALGIRAWSITRERTRWTELIGELWMAGALPRPAPSDLLSGRTRRSRRSAK